eukprot:3939420-Amphidinium_carterae.2
MLQAHCQIYPDEEAYTFCSAYCALIDAKSSDNNTDNAPNATNLLTSCHVNKGPTQGCGHSRDEDDIEGSGHLHSQYWFGLNA